MFSPAVIAAVFGAVGYALVLNVLLRLVRGSNLSRALESAKTIEKRLVRLDLTRDEILRSLQGSVPYDEFISRGDRVAELKRLLSQLKNASERLEKYLAQLQRRVEEEEALQDGLRRSSEAARTYTEDARVNSHRIVEVQQRIEQELGVSSAYLKKLNSEVALSAEQERAIAHLGDAVGAAQDHLILLREKFASAGERLAAIETQYSQLELEFQKLIDEELNS